MPTTQDYNQIPNSPYQAPALPDVSPAATPSPLPTEAPQVNGAVKTSGGVATIADGLLRGFMAGRAMHQAKQVMDFKKKDDNLQASYNNDAQRLYQLSQAGVDKNSPEFKEANAAVQGSWGALQDFRGQQITGGKKKGKKQDAQMAADPATLMARLHSQDPHEKAQALYELSQKAGPPVYGQIAVQQAQRQKQESDPGYQAQQNLSKLKARYSELGGKVNRTDEEESEYKQIGEHLASPGATGKPTPASASNIRAVAAGNILGSNLPHGAKDAEGNIIEPQPNAEYKSMVQGNKIFYIPQNANQQLKTTAQPGTGLPEQANYDPLAGTLGVNNPVGMAPVKTEYKNVTTTDDKGNPVTQITPITPTFRKPARNPALGASSAPTKTAGEPVLHRRDGTVVAPESAAPTVQATPAEGEAKPTYTQRAKTPEQKQVSKQLDKHVNEQLKAAGGTKTSGYTFDKFSKDNQQAFRAIQAQDLTINGKPGSKTDIGLRRATDDVMNSKDPDLKHNIAVAMNALDSYSKASLSSHTDGDYSFVKMLGSSWNTIPALNAAFSPLDKSPEGKVYLDNFFRAWTNAATIRALQGTTGKPSQSMYAMLVNELPMVGVNVHTRSDADRKMAMMQDDIDTAAGTLPDKLQGTLRRIQAPRASDKPAVPSGASDEVYAADGKTLLGHVVNGKYVKAGK